MAQPIPSLFQSSPALGIIYHQSRCPATINSAAQNQGAVEVALVITFPVAIGAQIVVITQRNVIVAT